MPTKKNIDEKEILQELKKPSTQSAAFSKIVQHYSEQLYWHIRRMVLSHDDTNDLMQNTFIKAWTSIDSFRGDSQLSTWLYRIAINETLTFLSKRTQSIPIDSPEASVVEQLESDTYFNGDKAEAIFQEALQKLPPKQRMVFNMKYYEEMKYEEMSEILGTSVGALKASYHIAVKKIEEFLKERD
jgi:RNA polymerase sigma-70 factor (ECF subfamily)